MIIEMRDRDAYEKYRQKTLIKALVIAGRYARWLNKNGRGSSYSTFHNEFGYDKVGSSDMYRMVGEILNLTDSVEVMKP